VRSDAGDWDASGLLAIGGHGSHGGWARMGSCDEPQPTERYASDSYVLPFPEMVGLSKKRALKALLQYSSQAPPPPRRNCTSLGFVGANPHHQL
jgi:hypothetical protein